MKRVIIIYILTFFSFCGFAQENQNIIQKAMKDELERNFKNLKKEGFKDPFYISYHLTDQTNTQTWGTLGSIVGSEKIPSRSQYVRLLVGDYEFNDESMNPQTDKTKITAYSNLLPLDEDYDGIRRSFWLTTDQVYFSASKYLDEFEKELKEEDKSIDEEPHRRFAKTPKVNLTKEVNVKPLNMNDLQSFVKQASAIFLKYKSIEFSNVYANQHFSTDYFINTEGSNIKTEKSVISISITAVATDDNGNPLSEHLTYTISKPKQMPSINEVERDVESLVEKIHLKKSAQNFADRYDGPVLIIDDLVTNVFQNVVLSKMSIADIENKKSGFERENFDEKRGKKILSEDISVALNPALEEYKGKSLLGSYPVDNEGVVPDENIVLVENGKVKNVMVGRTLTEDYHSPNGTNSGPGVVFVNAKGGLNVSKLKQKLIEEAKKEDLDYALMIKGKNRGGFRNLDVYKISLDDGSEELLRKANISNIDIKSLKNMIGISTETQVVNSLGYSLTSYICPQAILLPDVEVNKSYNSIEKDKNVVPNPLEIF